jgi:hypothetical protein
MAPAIWKEQLEAVDFVNVQTCVENGASGRDFFFVAQKSLCGSTTVSETPIDACSIYSYEFGKEIELQHQLRVYDKGVSTTIYLLAIQGRDADAAAGLCTTLRKEVPLWDIRLAIFELSSAISNPIPSLSQHLGIFKSGENVVFFDRDGGAHVSRVVLSPPPSIPAGQSGAANTDDPNHIIVRVSHRSGTFAFYDGFVGQVEHTGHSGFSVGDFVAGVVDASSSGEILHVSTNNLISVTNPAVDLAHKILGDILASFIALSQGRVAIAIENHDLGKILEQHASDTPQVQLVLTDFRDPDQSQRLDVLFSDSTTYAQYNHLRRWIPQSGKVVLLNQVLKEKIFEDPSYIRQTLAHIYSRHILSAPRSTPGGIDGQSGRSRAAPPFRNDRGYVLLGGIGGLGMDLAVWLYHVSAQPMNNRPGHHLTSVF